MKIVFFILFVAAFALQSQADQLAYISKSDAQEAVAFLKKNPKLFLFCGCCSMEKPREVTVIKAEVTYTGYEEYYEVIITYKTASGNEVTEAIDLAYAWKKSMFRYHTIGKLLGLEHDPCVYIKDWDDPKNAKKNL